MNTSYKVVKTFTNNVVKASNINGQEVILIGKGIGFQRKPNDCIASKSVETIFVVENKTEQEQYTQILKSVSKKLLDIADDVILYIQQRVNKPLNEHIHIALTDHIAFLVRRCKMGIPIENPFMFETEALYPNEHKLAMEVIGQLNDKLSIHIPDGEIGFITLHIVSALTNQSIGGMQKISNMIARLIAIIEDNLKITLDRSSLNYIRLITHIRFALERIERGELMSESKEIENVLKRSYPECYDLAWKLVKVMQQECDKSIDDAEAVYLGLHIYRFIKKEN